MTVDATADVTSRRPRQVAGQWTPEPWLLRHIRCAEDSVDSLAQPVFTSVVKPAPQNPAMRSVLITVVCSLLIAAPAGMYETSIDRCGGKTCIVTFRNRISGILCVTYAQVPDSCLTPYCCAADATRRLQQGAAPAIAEYASIADFAEGADGFSSFFQALNTTGLLGNSTAPLTAV